MSLKASKYLYICLVLLIVSCSKQKTFNSKKELIVFLNEESNQYLQVKNIKGINYSLMYRPLDLLVAQELDDKINESVVAKTRLKYKDYMYFNLSFSVDNKDLLSTIPKSKAEFSAMVNQLSFEMDKKIHLYTPKKDTLGIEDYIFPRTYGMNKATTLLLVYPRDRKILEAEYLNLTIEDLGIETGEVKFKIPTEIIKNEPNISFNN